jgi:hypothetical protein
MSFEKKYIVYGLTGEYEDQRDWSVRAFKTKEAANTFCKRCNNYVQGSASWSYDKRDTFIHPLDPYCQVDRNVGTTYIVGEVDYEDN